MSAARCYASISGNAELELAAANGQFSFCVFPLVSEAAKWNGVVLDASAARKLAGHILEALAKEGPGARARNSPEQGGERSRPSPVPPWSEDGGASV